MQSSVDDGLYTYFVKSYSNVWFILTADGVCNRRQGFVLRTSYLVLQLISIHV